MNKYSELLTSNEASRPNVLTYSGMTTQVQ